MGNNKGVWNENGEKFCKQCRRYLDIHAYGKCKSKPMGIHSICLQCRRRPGLKNAIEQLEEQVRKEMVKRSFGGNHIRISSESLWGLPPIPPEELIQKKLFNRWKFPDVCAYDLYIQNKRKKILR